MAVVRRNILTDAVSMQKFSEGINLLKKDFSAGVTTQTLGFGGPAFPVSAYDQFVIWHSVAMSVPVPNDDGTNPRDRNSAHRGSIFLPWHRFMLALMEGHLRRVLNDTSFGLPYWDWGADGDLTPPPTQPQSPLWKNSGIGGNGTPVTDGPFGFDQSNPEASFRVFFSEDVVSGQLVPLFTGRGLFRQLGLGLVTKDLPTTAQVTQVIEQFTEYDEADWDVASRGFRNVVEGWLLFGPNRRAEMHNRVHVWIGGDMGPSTSPNDPVFYLNHCNVDRIWEGWMIKHGRTYLPDNTTTGAPAGYRLDDTITSLVTTATTTPAAMLDVSALYSYDIVPADDGV